MTRGHGTGTVLDVGTIDRSSVSEAIQEAYADAIQKARKAMPPDPKSMVDTECADPCELILVIEFAKVEVTANTIFSIEGGGSAAVGASTEGAEATLEARISFDLDAQAVTAEIEWQIRAACVSPGVRHGEDPEDDFLSGESDPLDPHASSTVYGDLMPIRCPTMSEWGVAPGESPTIQSKRWSDIDESTVARLDAAARNAAMDAARDAITESLETIRRERRCAPPCSNEKIDINMGPVTSEKTLTDGGYKTYFVQWMAECPWFVNRACEAQ